MTRILAILLFAATTAMTIDDQGDMKFTKDEAVVVYDALVALGATDHPLAEEAAGSAARVTTGLDKRSFGVVMIALSKAAKEGSPACVLIKHMTPQAVCFK